MSKAKKKKKYAIVQSSNLDEFCARCNSLLYDGYEPIGGISTVVDIRNQNIIVNTQAFLYETNENNQTDSRTN